MQVLSILFFCLVIAIAIYLKWYNSPVQKGKRGEQRVHDILMQLPDEYFILDDVVLPTNRGTTQIDHIVVSKYGLFAIETKNYRGEIYGDDERQKWTQIIVTEVTYAKKWYKTYTYVTKNHFYNPVKQAVGHMYRIKEHLSDWSNLKVFPIVVFTGNATLKSIQTRNHVIYDTDLLATILSYKAVYLPDDDVRNIADYLARKDVSQFVDDKEHVRNVKSVQRSVEHKIDLGICPKCGGTLVQRHGKYGNFIGCSNYPNCRFTAQS